MTSFAFLSDSSFLKAGPATPATPFAVAGIAWDGAVTNRPGLLGALLVGVSAAKALCL